MTPEELNRTIEFIIQSQARLAAAQEQDREEFKEFEKWAKKITKELAASHQRMGELIEIESGRLDQHDREAGEARARYEKEAAEAQKRHESALARLDRILDKLTDRKN